MRVAAVVLSVGIALAVFLMRDQLSAFAAYGLPGIFVISVLTNATLILPAPGIAFIFAAGAVLNPIAVGVVAGLGGAIGELTGYVAGTAGSAVIEDRRRYEQIQGYMRRYGLLVIVVLSIIPNPLFDLAGIASGAMKLPVWQFLLAAFVGKTIKMTAAAFAGAGSAGALEWLIRTWL